MEAEQSSGLPNLDGNKVRSQMLIRKLIFHCPVVDWFRSFGAGGACGVAKMLCGLMLTSTEQEVATCTLK